MGTTEKYIGLRDYLYKTGVLESGDESLIKKVKAAYWRNYYKEYKRDKREQNKEYSISLNPEERVSIGQEAKRHNQSISLFIKRSAWSYIHKAYLIPDRADLVRLEQLISSCHTELTQIRESKSISGEIAGRIADTLNYMENTVGNMVSEPQNIEGKLRQILNERPHYSETLKSIIKEYDNKVEGQEIEDGN